MAGSGRVPPRSSDRRSPSPAPHPEHTNPGLRPAAVARVGTGCRNCLESLRAARSFSAWSARHGACYRPELPAGCPKAAQSESAARAGRLGVEPSRSVPGGASRWSTTAPRTRGACRVRTRTRPGCRACPPSSLDLGDECTGGRARGGDRGPARRVRHRDRRPPAALTLPFTGKFGAEAFDAGKLIYTAPGGGSGPWASRAGVLCCWWLM